MPKNIRGGKGAKALSNKKEQQKREVREARERCLIVPEVDGGTIICEITEVYGGGRYKLVCVTNNQTYGGVLRNSERSLRSRAVKQAYVLAQFRECDTLQKNLDIITVYSDDQTSRLREGGYIPQKKEDSESTDFNIVLESHDDEVDSDEEIDFDDI